MARTGKHLGSAGEEAAPVSEAVGSVAGPAELGAELEQTLATLVGHLEGPALLEALSPDRLSGIEGLIHAEEEAQPTAGRAGPSGSTPASGELLPEATARWPEPRLAAAVDDHQEQAPITAVVPLPVPSVPSAPAAARVSPRSSTAPSFPAPAVLPAVVDEAQAGAAQAASPDRRPSGPPPLDRPLSGNPGPGSGTGGSIFIPLLGALALLALAAPRGYRRRRAVRDFPVLTPFVCALERPG